MTTAITNQRGTPAWQAARIIDARSRSQRRRDWLRWLLILAGLAVSVAWLWFCAYSEAALRLWVPFASR